MLRWLTAAAILLAGTSVHAEKLSRETCQRVVSAQHRGFRILSAKDYEEWLRPSFRDGDSGALLVGNFDYDDRLDFAAYIVAQKPKRYDAGKYSYDYFEGELITCHALPDSETFTCDADERSFVLPHDTMLALIPPGRHECPGDGDRTVVTRIDSIEEGSEKGSHFVLLNPDGTTDVCTTGD